MQTPLMAGFGMLPLSFGSSGGLGATYSGSSWCTSAPSTADCTVGCLDRQRLGRQYHSMRVVLPWSAVNPDAALIRFNIGVQDAPNATGGAGGWADLAGSIIGSTGTRRAVTQGPSVTSSAGWTYGCAYADFNIQPARRYVRAAWNIDASQATSSGLQVVVGQPVLMLGGANELPVDSNFRTCST